MQTLQFRKEQGHIIIPMDKRMALVDTGSPFSISQGHFEWCGRKHAPQTNFMGFTTQKISKIAGIQIDILLGCNVLSEQDIRIRWRDNELDVGSDIPDAPIVGKLSTIERLPIFPITLKGRDTRAFFDTGAHLAYIAPEIVKEDKPLSKRDDFYPFVGRFTVPTYLVSTTLHGITFDIEYGVLPDSLQGMLGMAMTKAGSLAVIGTQLLEHFDCTISWARQTVSWRQR